MAYRPTTCRAVAVDEAGPQRYQEGALGGGDDPFLAELGTISCWITVAAAEAGKRGAIGGEPRLRFRQEHRNRGHVPVIIVRSEEPRFTSRERQEVQRLDEDSV